MKKVLIVTYQFPPVAGAGTYIVLGLMKPLPQHNWSPTVLTTRFVYRSNPKYPLLTKDIPEETAIYRAFNPELIGILPGRWATRLNHRLMVPDEVKAWFPFAVRVGMKAIKSENIDLIFAMGPPLTALLVGTRLKELSGKPLITDFLDLRTQNPKIEWTCMRYKRNYEKVRELEEKVVRSADYIITVTEGMKQGLIDQYPFIKDKIRIVSNGYCEDRFSYVKAELSINPSSKFTISYTGSFYDTRSPIPFLTALKEAISELPELRENIQIQFMGKLATHLRRPINELNLGDILLLKGHVPHFEAIQCLLESDALLLVIAKAKKGDEMIITSKVYEYLASGKPILALVPPDGLAADLIREAKAGLVINPEDVDSIKKGILKFYNMYKNGNCRFPIDSNVVGRYEYKRLSSELANVFYQVINLKARRHGA